MESEEPTQAKGLADTEALDRVNLELRWIFKNTDIVVVPWAKMRMEGSNSSDGRGVRWRRPCQPGSKSSVFRGPQVLGASWSFVVVV